MNYSNNFVSFKNKGVTFTSFLVLGRRLQQYSEKKCEPYRETEWSTSGRAMAMTRSGLPLPAHARRTHMRPRRSRWPTPCAMMFLSRSVWMFPDKSVWQSQTRSAPTSHYRSARIFPRQNCQAIHKKVPVGSAGRSLRRFANMDTQGLLLDFQEVDVYLKDNAGASC